MRHTLLILIISAMITTITAQTSQTVGQALNTSTTSDEEESPIDAIKALHKKYGTAKMVLKDRGVYKRITVHEINGYWLVFLKDGSLHDMLIERIARIQFGKEYGPVVTFSETNKIIIRY